MKWGKHLEQNQSPMRARSILGPVLGLATGNVVRTFAALAGRASMPDLPLSVSWTYLATSAALWSVVFLVCAASLAWLRRWGRVLTLASVTLYEAHVWVDHLLFDRSDYALQTRPWGLVFTLLLLGLTWGALNWPSVRALFCR